MNKQDNNFLGLNGTFTQKEQLKAIRHFCETASPEVIADTVEELKRIAKINWDLYKSLNELIIATAQEQPLSSHGLKKVSDNLYIITVKKRNLLAEVSFLLYTK